MADFDENVRKALESDEAFQGLLQQLKEAATSEVTVYDREPCPKNCGCKHFRVVKVPDYNTKLKIMEFLANRGVGRPQQAEGETGESIHFEQVFDWGCPNCTCQDCLKDRGEKPQAEI